MEKWLIGKAPFFLNYLTIVKLMEWKWSAEKEDQSDLEILTAYGSDCTEMGDHVEGLISTGQSKC